MIASVGSQLSLEVGDPVLAGSVLAVQEIVMVAGQLIVGALLSSMVMTWLHVAKLPQSSCDRHVRVIVYSWLHEGSEEVTSV